MILLAVLSMSYQQDESQLLHRSIHDEFMRDKTITPVNLGPRDLQATQTFKPYRVQFDWSVVDAWLPQQPRDQQASLQNKINFMKGVFVTVHTYMTSRYEVLSRDTMVLPKVGCFGVVGADKFYNQQIEK